MKIGSENYKYLIGPNYKSFIEKEGKLVAHGRREGRMFILELNEVKSAMLVKGLKVETDLKLWHKRISHINLQKLKGM